MFFIPAITAYINHYWRGQAKAPRYAYYTFMALLAYCLTLNPIFVAKWMVFIVGYAMMPWEAMFSAINGQAPGRKDKLIQWMQDLALWLYPNDWYKFGIAYGTIRACLMLPGVYLLGSWWGVSFLLMGYVYYLCGKWSMFETKTISIAVSLAEVIMGTAIGMYLLQVA